MALSALAALQGGCMRFDYENASRPAETSAQGGRSGGGKGGGSAEIDAGAPPTDANPDEPDPTMHDGEPGDDAGSEPQTPMPDASTPDAAAGDASGADAEIDAGPPPDPTIGAWSGAVDDDSGTAYSVCVVITQVAQAGATGGTLAATDNADASCGGVWRRSDLTYESTAAGTHHFTETVTYRPVDCSQQDGGTLDIRDNGDNTVRYEWTVSGGSAVWARATLQPVASCP
jgi:hypothetical protein